MPIRILDGPEPLSEQSLRSRYTGDLMLVESEATRVLRQELRRYCEGHIAGRSFLIAGHRGAGKSTLVAKAFLDTWLERERDGAPFLRPLFIPLHGPSLFPSPEAGSAPKEAEANAANGQKPDPSDANNKKPDASAAEAKKPAAPPKSEAQIALEQITLGLHRAVAREFTRCFYERVADLAYLRRSEVQAREQIAETRSSRTGVEEPDPYPTIETLERILATMPPDRELFELAAQFESELYEGPPPQRLREFWDRLGAASGGVLFREGSVPSSARYGAPPPPPGMRLDRPEVHVQGVRELVALSGVVEAYRRISGEYKRSEQQKEKVEGTQQRTVGFEGVGKDLATSITSVLTGGLAAAGVAVSGASPLATSAAGLAAALGTALVFKVSSTRKRERAISRDYQFIFDLSVATLDRALPILIERLRQAGLAPVFVVDELDKVKRLGARIVTMVHHLKKLVAENAFFCFLTNRSYFEEMLSTGAGRPYPVEYTYYTHRLFVVFSPEDFERYLHQRIPDPPPRASTPQGTPDSAATDERNASAILRWALRHRAQLHVVDLQRAISALRDDAGLVSVPPTVLASSQRTVIDATAQVAIELRFAQRDLQQATANTPEFRRLLNDAMYYLTREWLDGEEAVDLSWETGYDAFKSYLERRTGRDEERDEEKNHAGVPALAEGLSRKDCQFLFEQVQLLADFLSDRPSHDGTSTTPTRDWRREMLAEWNQGRVVRGLPELEPTVSDALLLGETSSLLVRQEGTLQFRFRYPVTGSARRDTAVPASVVRAEGVPARPIWDDDVEFIGRFANALMAVQGPPGPGPEPPVSLETLGSVYSLISPTPAWKVVEAAITRLRDSVARGIAHSSYDEDVFHVRQFRDVLSRNADRIARGLACAAVVGRAAQVIRPSALDPIPPGLAAMSNAYAFARRDELDVGRAIDTVMAQITQLFGRQVFGGIVGPPTPGVITTADVTEYRLHLRDLIYPSVPITLPVREWEQDAWRDVLDRLMRWFETGPPGDPELAEVVAAAADTGPAKVLHTDPRAVTISEWVHILVESLSTLPPAPGTRAVVPRWLSLVALHALGFRFSLDQQADLAGLLGLAPWSRVSSSQNPTDRSLQFVTEGRLLRGSPPHTTVVAVRRTSSTLFAEMHPAAGHAILVATINELAALSLSTAGGAHVIPWIPETERRVVAVEMEPDSTNAVEREIEPALAKALRDPWVVYVYDQDRGREARQPAAIKPAGIAEIAEVAVKMQRPLRPTTPPATPNAPR